jgi:hypothetical protein
VEDEATGGLNGIDPEQIENFMVDNSGSADVATDAVARVIQALSGGNVEGVTVSVNVNVVNASVDMDFDDDGTSETTVNLVGTFADATLSLDDPALVEVTDVEHESVSGSAQSTAQSIGTNAVLFSEMSGSFSGSLATVDITDGAVTVEYSFLPAFVSGFMDIEIGGFPLELTFESDGVGGWQTHVQGEGVDFIVP